jgi:hypothetical protein
MNKHIGKITLSLLMLSVFLYSYVDKQNDLTRLKIELPKIAHEVMCLNEENKKLQYAIDQFENPLHLMELARSSEYAHLKHPYVKDVLKVQEGLAIKEHNETIPQAKRHLPYTVGSK